MCFVHAAQPDAVLVTHDDGHSAQYGPGTQLVVPDGGVAFLANLSHHVPCQVFSVEPGTTTTAAPNDDDGSVNDDGGDDPTTR